jgi:hypothetical protein
MKHIDASKREFMADYVRFILFSQDEYLVEQYSSNLTVNASDSWFHKDVSNSVLSRFAIEFKCLVTIETI